MEKSNKVLVIDINKVPEFIDAKKKQEKLVKDHPFIKIKDGATYDTAKKRRTAVRSGRILIQNDEKQIASKIRQFRDLVKEKATNLISITKTHEEKQQAEIDLWEKKIKERSKERARKKAEQAEAWQKKSVALLDYLIKVIDATTTDEVLKVKEAVISEEITEKGYGEFKLQATENITKVLAAIEDKLTEIEEAEMKATGELIAARKLYTEHFQCDIPPRDLSTSEVLKIVEDDRTEKLKELEQVKAGEVKDRPDDKKEPEAEPNPKQEEKVITGTEKSVAQQIGEEIYADCKEHIKANGPRFFGTSWAEIEVILTKYGFESDIPF